MRHHQHNPREQQQAPRESDPPLTYCEPGQYPERFKGLIGKKVTRAWATSAFGIFRLIFTLEPDNMIIAKRDFSPNGRDAIWVDGGTVKPEFDPANIDKTCSRLDELTGLVFSGIDQDIIMFGTDQGVRMFPDRIELVKAMQ